LTSKAITAKGEEYAQLRSNIRRRGKRNVFLEKEDSRGKRVDRITGWKKKKELRHKRGREKKLADDFRKKEEGGGRRDKKPPKKRGDSSWNQGPSQGPARWLAEEKKSLLLEREKKTAKAEDRSAGGEEDHGPFPYRKKKTSSPLPPGEGRKRTSTF